MANNSIAGMFADCSQKLNCIYHNQKTSLELQNKILSDKLTKLKKCKEIANILPKDIEVETLFEMFENLLNNEINTNFTQEIKILKSKLDQSSIEKNKLNSEIEKLKKQKNNLQEVIDRDEEMQTLERNFHVLKKDYEKISNKYDILKNNVKISQDDLEHANDCYNDKAKEFNLLLKNTRKLEKHFNILDKKRFREQKKQQKKLNKKRFWS